MIHQPLPDAGEVGADLDAEIAQRPGRADAGAQQMRRRMDRAVLAKIDAEYADYARQVGDEAEQQARDYLRDTSVEVETTYRATTGRSVSSALVEAVHELGGSALVIGSTADGPEGRIVTGATAEKLLHSAPVPLAISPRYQSIAAAGFTRLTCAFSDSESSVRTVAHAAELAKQLGAPMGGELRGPPRDDAHRRWGSRPRTRCSTRGPTRPPTQRRLVADGVIDAAVPCVIGTGSGWVESVGSIDWQRDELLAIGSSAAGPLARVFLGSRAAKLIRAAPVPW